MGTLAGAQGTLAGSTFLLTAINVKAIGRVRNPLGFPTFLYQEINHTSLTAWCGTCVVSLNLSPFPHRFSEKASAAAAHERYTLFLKN
jgi:hypothetical protein